jgi:hypothetical protein
MTFQLQLKGTFAARYTDAPAEASAGHPKCGVMPTEGGLETHLRRVVIGSDVAEAGSHAEMPHQRSLTMIECRNDAHPVILTARLKVCQIVKGGTTNYLALLEVHPPNRHSPPSGPNAAPARQPAMPTRTMLGAQRSHNCGTQSTPA